MGPNAERLQKLFDRFWGQGDWQAGRDLFAPNVEWIGIDLIVTESKFRGRGRGSGIEFEAELGQIWEFRDGQVVRQTMFRSYEEARRAADALVQADAR